MRPYWKGYLKLALVSCPIALHAACSTAERIAFRQINKATGNRLRQQLIDEETREPVDPERKGRGYEVARGQYLIVEDEELEAIEIESTHVIEIDSFVPRQQIDQRFFDAFISKIRRWQEIRSFGWFQNGRSTRWCCWRPSRPSSPARRSLPVLFR